MNKTAPRLPVIVNRKHGKVVIEIRRESDTEIMQQALNLRGKIVLRVSIQHRGKANNWSGWHGSGMMKTVHSIKEAREFQKALRQFVEGEKNGNESNGS